MAPSNDVLSSGSVVFALPHIRETIFRYHAIELAKERTRQLDAIDRPVTEAFWSSFPTADMTTTPKEWFAKRRDTLISETNLLAVLAKLGLQLADYVHYLASRPNDTHFWVVACSVLGSSRRWETSYRDEMRLEAAPRELRGGADVHEEPHSNPIEMLWHGYGHGYSARILYVLGTEWEEMEGLGHLLRDDVGRTFFFRLLNTSHQNFFFKAATQRPEVLYSKKSPFWPIYEVINYNDGEQVGAAIWQCPPTPMSVKLLTSSRRPYNRDELRRQLERAHSLLGHLATLQEWGISLAGLAPFSESLGKWWSTRGKASTSVISAYLGASASVEYPGRFARTGYLEERLPPAPHTAWPLAPLTGNGGIAGLPWCQTTAYTDPRVPGPKYFLYGPVEGIWSDAEYTQKTQPYRWVPGDAAPADRFNHNLLDLTNTILVTLFPSTGGHMVELLECPALSQAYEECLRKEGDAPPRNCETAHSGLFDFCPNCVLNWWPKSNYKTSSEQPSRCAACGHYDICSAIPDAFRLLLLRILKPETREDGSKIILTAKEVHETMTSIMARETPRLTRLYTQWAEKQHKVVRIDTAGPLPLDKIRQDVSHYRWLMLEMLRGNFLDARFRKKEYVDLRDAMVAFHAEKRRRDEEREAKREARGKGLAAPPTVGASNSGSSAPTPTSEAEVSAQLSTAPCEGAKRSASAVDEGTAVKKLKGA